MEKVIQEELNKISQIISAACQHFIFERRDSEKIKKCLIDALMNSEVMSEQKEKLRTIMDSWEFEYDNDSMTPANGRTAISMYLLINRLCGLDSIIQIIQFPDIFEYKVGNIGILWKDKRLYITPQKALEYIEIKFTIDKDGNIIK